MRKNKLLLLLALLMTAATGAWAQDAKHLITATYFEQTRSLEQPLPYATTIGEFYEAVTGQQYVLCWHASYRNHLPQHQHRQHWRI